MQHKISTLTISGLQPQGLYEGQIINFGLVNFLIGKNGSGKTQILNKIHQKIKNKLSPLREEYAWVGKMLQANRAHVIQGSRELRGERLDVFETDHPTAESFFQFLNDSEMTKAIVESRLRAFFRKSLRIRPQGRNITMEILERWKLKEEELQEITEAMEEEPGTLVNLSSESDGMKEFLILLTYVYNPRSKYVVIDEPELHLHPHMINFVSDAIEDTAKNGEKQFFIVTHSPISIRLSSDSEWKYFFFLKEKNEVVTFDQFSQPEYASLIPYLNPFKREAFYSDLIILVEGEWDYQVFQNLAKRMGYSETQKGGFTFFPSWGGYEFERLFNFFQKLGKEVRVVTDSGMRDKQKAGFSENFKNNVLDNTNVTKTLSVKDIVLLLKKKQEFYPDKENLSFDEKREILREEITLINNPSFNESDYSELIGIIREFLGRRSRTTLPKELVETTQRLVAEFQLRFSKRPFKQWIENNEVDKVKKAINKNDYLRPYWQDADQNSFNLQATGQNWACELVFSIGSVKIKIAFDKNTDHAQFKPKVVE